MLECACAYNAKNDHTYVSTMPHHAHASRCGCCLVSLDGSQLVRCIVTLWVYYVCCWRPLLVGVVGQTRHVDIGWSAFLFLSNSPERKQFIWF